MAKKKPKAPKVDQNGSASVQAAQVQQQQLQQQLAAQQQQFQQQYQQQLVAQQQQYEKQVGLLSQQQMSQQQNYQQLTAQLQAQLAAAQQETQAQRGQFESQVGGLNSQVGNLQQLMTQQQLAAKLQQDNANRSLLEMESRQQQNVEARTGLLSSTANANSYTKQAQAQRGSAQLPLDFLRSAPQSSLLRR